MVTSLILSAAGSTTYTTSSALAAWVAALISGSSRLAGVSASDDDMSIQQTVFSLYYLTVLNN